MTTILILSVGSLVGTNILDAVEEFRPSLRVIGLNSEIEAPNNFRCDKVYLGPPACDVHAYWKRVDEILRRDCPDLVLAGRDDDIGLMAQWRELNPHWADRFVVGSATLSLPMTDKLSGHDWAIERGLPFAPTVSARAPRALEQCLAWMSELDCALIAKPRAGNGSRGVRLLLDGAALQANLGDADLVIQPYLSVAEPYQALAKKSALGLPLFWTPTLTQYVAQTVISPNGDILGRFDMEAQMVAGRCERAVAFTDPEFRKIGDHCAAKLAEAGWRGPVAAQMVRHEKLGYQIIEFCARAGGALMERLLLGFDEMALILSAWTQQSFARPRPQPINAFVLRVTHDVGLKVSDCAQLSKTGEWPSGC